MNVPPRARSTAVEARGIFPGAKVVRGHNWKWKNQDGIHFIFKTVTVTCMLILSRVYCSIEREKSTKRPYTMC